MKMYSNFIVRFIITLASMNLACENVFKFSKPESCIANFKEENLDFDTEKKFLYFTSNNPKVSNLLISEHEENLWKRELGFLSYNFQGNDQSILVDLKNRILHPPDKGYYSVISKDIFSNINEKKNEINIYRVPNQKIFTMPYNVKSNASVRRKNLINIEDRHKEGVIDMDGKVIVPFQYDDIDFGSSDASPIIAKKDQKKDFYDRNGKLLLSMTQDLANGDSINTHSDNGFILFQKNSFWGVLDQTTKQIVPPIFESISSFHNGLAAVRKNDLWGYIDEKGKVIVPIKYQSASEFHNSIGTIQDAETNECILIDTLGVEFYRFPGVSATSNYVCQNYNTRTYIKVRTGSKGIAKIGNSQWEEIDFADSPSQIDGDYIISKNNKYGIVSHDERYFIPTIYDQINFNQNKRQFTISLDGKSALFDRDGKPLSNFLAGLVYDCNEGNCLVQDPKTGKFGYTESNGKVIIEATLDYGEGFSEGFSKVSKNGKWEFIDRNGKSVLTLPNGDFGSYSGGVFLRKEGSLFGYQNIDGQWIIEPTLSYAETLVKGIAIIIKDGKFGLVGKNGKYLVPPKWDKIVRENYPEDAFTFTLENKSGIALFSNCNEAFNTQ